MQIAPSDPTIVDQKPDSAAPQLNQLEVLARHLAENQTVAEHPVPGHVLLDRLEVQARVLREAYRHFNGAAQEGSPFSVAGEWMLDNFYIVEQTLRLAREDMPVGYYKQLPKLSTSPLAGYPRVFALAWEVIGYSWNQLDIEQVTSFVRAYEQVRPLTMGELWALPTMLRLGIVDKLAGAVARITGLDAHPDSLLPTALPAAPPPPDDVLVANCFLALRMLLTQDWKSFFESISLVEQTLRLDPARIYERMDFETRNQYRRIVEEIARSTHQSEDAVAQKVIELAHGAQPSSQPNSRMADRVLHDIDRAEHVGFYLLDKGRAQLEGDLGYQPPLAARLRRWLHDRPTFTYLGGILLLTAFVITCLVAYAATAGAGVASLILTGALAFLPATALAVAAANWLVTHTIPPWTLPRLDFEDGIPAECRTMVVVPTLLSNTDDVDSLLQELELHLLRNNDSHLSFALLTDFADAPDQHAPDDDTLIERATTGIRALNDKYRDRASSPFFFFHRARLWNPAEGCWMGWERKRGKLTEFNHLLKGSTTTSYIIQEGDLSILPHIRYVITLDVDTILPQGGASRLVATLAHPLNRATFAPDSDKLIAGYTVLQPRVEIKPTSGNQSWFTRIFAGDVGLDLYTRAASDVYQDLFGMGTYVGKGIYDVAAFERSLAGRVPENALLSHDLFEGIHGRVALVTDTSLFEDYPTHYLVYTSRLHRWIRGDWQLLPWLLPRVPTAQGNAPNRFSLIARWKIFDNLRRSLVAPSLMALLAAGWLGLPGSAWVWTCVALLILAFPLVAHAIPSVLQSLGRKPLREALQPLEADSLRWLLAVVFLAHEALLALDAIMTTLYRLLVSRKNLLRWTTAAHTARLFGSEAGSVVTWNQMSASIVGAGLLGLAVALLQPAALPVAVPLVLVWLASPQVAHWISRPIIHQPLSLSADQRQQLRSLARRTWLFFEQFVGPDDHWLPPDHFQEAPRPVIAHHTSPTNIGLFLLSILAAHDLGYIDLLGLALRLRSTFEGMDQLERYRGHLLNWYDTRTLAPLSPRYVSTVDSGNLAGCLVALRQGCLAMRLAPVMTSQSWQALYDVLIMLSESLTSLSGDDPDKAEIAFQSELERIRQSVLAAQENTDQWAALLLWLSGEGWQALSASLMALIDSNKVTLDAEVLSSLRLSMDRLQRHLISLRGNMDLLLPWLIPFNDPPALFVQLGLAPATSVAWQALKDSLMTSVPPLGEATSFYENGKQRLAELMARLDEEHELPDQVELARAWCARLIDGLDTARLRAQTLLIAFQDIADQAEAYFQAMDFGFLFNVRRQVFHIGYNVTNGKLDDNYYDLLASESRIASLICIAKGDVPRSHWLHLGRPVTEVGGVQALLSWSGTMFEYLMPPLLMRDYPGTFLSQSEEAAVDYQISYGEHRRVPWGISESGYYAFDANMNYQYQAFGAPRLGFKRGLAEDIVIAPYASLIALSVRPQDVMTNLTRLGDLGMLRSYGLYEAIDYTKARLLPGQKHALVQSYMAHHQGMIFLALCNYFCGDAMVSRFHADPRIQSVELLLQEKIPQEAPVEYPHQEVVSDQRPAVQPVNVAPWRVAVDTAVPQAHFLAQGNYGLLITNAGGGYSQWKGLALTRWQADSTLDNWGTWLYVQDRASGELWSAAYQPTATPPEGQEVLFYPHKAEFRRWQGGISLTMEILVMPDEVEVRRITLANNSDQPRQLRLVSYGEVVLAPQAADQRHPAFSKLFVESEYVADGNVLLFRRRPRSSSEKAVYLAHALVVGPGQTVSGEHETDRARFLGRGQTLRWPRALQKADERLSATVGATLDPIFALGQEIDLEPHATAQLAYLTLASTSREDALAMVGRYQVWSVVERGSDLARIQSEIELRQLGLTSPDIDRIDQLLSVLLYPFGGLRAAPGTLMTNDRGQPGLWAFGISGDYPILLAKINKPDSLLVHELLQAHAYWRNRQIKINLVFLNEQDTGYSLDSHNQLFRQFVRVGAQAWLNQREGIFLIRADQISEPERVLLQTVARAVLDDSQGSLAEQLGRIGAPPVRLPPFAPTWPDRPDFDPAPVERPNDLLFDNGLGGFSADGREYVIYLESGQWTPRPWINVIANPELGFLVSESGMGATWVANSGENRLTPWRNDPIGDAPAEALYLRDEETAQVWSPTPLPARASMPYLIRHGAGYSIFEHNSHGLRQTLRLFAAQDAPLKVVQLSLENTSNSQRRITVTYYAELVLGTTREGTQQYILPEYDGANHALFVRNRYSVEFGERVAFVAADKELHGLTVDRTEFLGRMGSLENPAALGRIGLAGAVQPGLDPCAALQVHVDLPPGDAKTVFFLVGEAADRSEAVKLIEHYQSIEQVEAAWRTATLFWEDLLTSITVQTPDPAMNLLLNRWLLYQTLACRLWGRSAMYQSSGAFGFRDQLQDVMALLHAKPSIAREHILRAARHQFEAGDVLHWWHPPSGRGVRTRISDDLLWLPFVTAHYVASTGDEAILSEKVPYLQGERLKPDEEERYGSFEPTSNSYTLYEHCRQALSKGSTAGSHGLPLMGTGDWNDGMNRVGAEGQGESVWLGWFLYTTLCRFAPLCELRDDAQQAVAYRQQAEQLREALEGAAWDGEWYRRAYYDDGSALGSRQSGECQIDSIAQSWAVLSGAANSQRAAQAMKSVEKWLVRRDDQLILLLTPPFYRTARDPGYIKGYLPGIRENGGQYTHAALWAVWAFAEMDQGDIAEELFRLLNPIYHADTPTGVVRYQVEPYVVAADVYGIAPHTGHGGWTWYTGSSGWMYRLGIEAILGIKRMEQTLQINPCIPRHWRDFALTYRDGPTYYEIRVANPDGFNRGVKHISMDGAPLPDRTIPLLGDAQRHQVRVEMGRNDELTSSAQPRQAAEDHAGQP